MKLFSLKIPLQRNNTYLKEKAFSGARGLAFADEHILVNYLYKALAFVFGHHAVVTLKKNNADNNQQGKHKGIKKFRIKKQIQFRRNNRT